jgi:hypothetical protein
MIDQILYPESEPESTTESGKSEPEPESTSPVIADVKEFNELVNGAVIDSAEDDSAGKLMIVIYIY